MTNFTFKSCFNPEAQSLDLKSLILVNSAENAVLEFEDFKVIDSNLVNMNVIQTVPASILKVKKLSILNSNFSNHLFSSLDF